MKNIFSSDRKFGFVVAKNDIIVDCNYGLIKKIKKGTYGYANVLKDEEEKLRVKWDNIYISKERISIENYFIKEKDFDFLKTIKDIEDFTKDVCIVSSDDIEEVRFGELAEGKFARVIKVDKIDLQLNEVVIVRELKITEKIKDCLAIIERKNGCVKIVPIDCLEFCDVEEFTDEQSVKKEVEVGSIVTLNQDLTNIFDDILVEKGNTGVVIAKEDNLCLCFWLNPNIKSKGIKLPSELSFLKKNQTTNFWWASEEKLDIK